MGITLHHIYLHKPSHTHTASVQLLSHARLSSHPTTDFPVTPPTFQGAMGFTCVDGWWLSLSVACILIGLLCATRVIDLSSLDAAPDTDGDGIIDRYDTDFMENEDFYARYDGDELQQWNARDVERVHQHLYGDHHGQEQDRILTREEIDGDGNGIIDI